jgi:hypothetical protein
MKIDKFLAELKRRNVYKVAIAYVVGGWALSEGISQVFPVFDVSNALIRLIVILIIAGLPVALVFAWMFEITPEGIKRTATADAMPASSKPKKYLWLYIVIIGSTVSIGLFLLGRYTAVDTASPARTSNKSIAVLPFSDLSPNHDQESFSVGMAEEILNALAHIRGLKVVGRSSSFFYKGKNVSLKQIGSELGVANVLEGSRSRSSRNIPAQIGRRTGSRRRKPRIERSTSMRKVPKPMRRSATLIFPDAAIARWSSLRNAQSRSIRIT